MSDDLQTLKWENADGSIDEFDFTLREMADLQAGKAVAGFFGHRHRHYTLREQIVAIEARQEGLDARKREMEREFPGIGDGEWD